MTYAEGSLGFSRPFPLTPSYWYSSTVTQYFPIQGVSGAIFVNELTKTGSLKIFNYSTNSNMTMNLSCIGGVANVAQGVFNGQVWTITFGPLGP